MRPGRDGDHSTASSAEVKKELSYTSTHLMGPPGPVTGLPLPLPRFYAPVFISIIFLFIFFLRKSYHGCAYFFIWFTLNSIRYAIILVTVDSMNILQ
jgi:hypothetical protein